MASVSSNDSAGLAQMARVMGMKLGPHQMTIPYGEDQIDEAIEYLQTVDKKRKENNNTVSVKKVFEAHPLDGAYNLAMTLKEKFNWTALVATPTLFGETPPGMISLELADGKEIDIPWGRVEIPDLRCVLGTSVSSNGLRFVVEGRVPKKEYEGVQEVFDLLEKRLKTHSIYKGQAIKLFFPEDGEDFSPIFDHAPELLNLKEFDTSKLVFSDIVTRTMERDLFRVMENTQRCRDRGISLKRGILLEGPPGVGKTMAAMMAGKRAVNAGWTFVYADSCNALKPTIEFALQHQPAVVFAEDIDRANMGQDNPEFRNEMMNAIMNIMDGIENKGTELIVILTTNHLDRITPAMKRPGRLDSIISLRLLDEPAVDKLVRMYSGEALPKDTVIPLDLLKDMVAYSPAAINEIVQKAKLHTIDRDPIYLEPNDFRNILVDMRESLEIAKKGPGY